MSNTTQWTHSDLEDIYDSYLTKAFGVVAFTILIWDHIVTFPDEVEYIWKRSKGRLVYLFLLNRYLTPLGFIVNLCVQSKGMLMQTSLFIQRTSANGHTRCVHFVRYEGSMTMIGISIVSIMMFFRIQALYHTSRYKHWIQGFVLTILAAFIGTNSWLLVHGEPVSHDAPTVHSCSMIFDPSIGSIATSSAWFPLLYDTVVVGLTINAFVWRTSSAGEIMRVLLEEGLLYYSVMFSVTLALTIMIAKASTTVKNLMAQLELLLTVTMMSRITLDLKRFGHHQSRIGAGTVAVPVKDPPGLTRHPHHHDCQAYQDGRCQEVHHDPTHLSAETKRKLRDKRNANVDESSTARYGFGAISASSWRSVGAGPSKARQSATSRGLGLPFEALKGLLPRRRGAGEIQHVERSTYEAEDVEDSFFSRVTAPSEMGNARTIDTVATRGGGGTRDDGVEVWQEVEVVREGEEWWLGKNRGLQRPYVADEEAGLEMRLKESMRQEERDEREEGERQRAYREAGRKRSGESGSSGRGSGSGRHDPPMEMVEMAELRRPKPAVDATRTRGRSKHSMDPPPGFRGIGFDRDGL